jgi:hypothetical protein
MTFRIIRKTIEGYEPSYYFQERYLGFWWCTIWWSTDYEHIKQAAEKHLYNLRNHPEDKVLWKAKL